MQPEYISLVGIKHPNGSIESVLCMSGESYGQMQPFLTQHYAKFEDAQALVACGDFMALGITPTQTRLLANASDYTLAKHPSKFANFHSLHTAITEGLYIENLYIWVDGVWACGTIVPSGALLPLRFFEQTKGKGKNRRVVITHRAMTVEEFEERYFPEKIVPVVSLKPRLSKEDWLRQHYPELSELPKWRFPAMVGG
jgi:hypothetical protein